MSAPMTALLMTALLCAVSAAADSLSLQDAQQLLFENNQLLAISELEQRRARLDAVEARSQWFPTVDLFASWGYRSEETTALFDWTLAYQLDDTTVMEQPVRFTQPFTDRDRWEAGVDISWTAFKGFSRNHIVRAAEIASRQSDTRLAALQNRFSLDLGQLFFAWELAYHNLAVHKTHMRQLSEHAGRIRELHHGGLRARSKVLEAEARLEAAKVQLVRSEHKADSLRLELCSLLNIGDSAIVPSSYDFQRLTVGVPQMRQQPDSNRNELAILAMDRERTALARKALTAERYPALLLNAGYRYANPGLYLGYNQQMNYGTLGLSLRWTIYDGMKHWARIRKLEQREEIIDTRRAKQYAEWEKRAQLARKQLENAHRIMAAAQLSLKAARQLEKDLVNALNAGVVVSDEYLNALAAVAQAQFEVARAEALKKGALLRLEFALGETIRF